VQDCDHLICWGNPGETSTCTLSNLLGQVTASFSATETRTFSDGSTIVASISGQYTSISAFAL